MTDEVKRHVATEDRAAAAPARALPLTERAGGQPADDCVTEAEIRTLVDSFYDTLRRDDLLGPIFAHHVKDWSLHLPTMYAFWSTVIRRTGRYAGRPFEIHQALPNLTPAHFERWLTLWEVTVAQVFGPQRVNAQQSFVVAARRMAVSISARIPVA